jgi:ATP-dependent HslUV protease subunit HslV
MTTIIATRELMVSDTRCTFPVPFFAAKIYRAGGSLFGGAGDSVPIEKFIAWKRGADRPEFGEEDNFTILELDRDGLWMWDKNLVRLEVRNKFYAIGTGAQYAMGAMEAGATPAEAVKISARYDEHTGLPIETMKLEG